MQTGNLLIHFLKSNTGYYGKNNVKNKLERTTYQDIISFSANKESSGISEKTKEMLDNTKFIFIKNNGEKFEGTIKEYLKNSIIRKSRIFPRMSMFHCTQTKETGENIIKSGLDWTKTIRKKCGPGTYFSMSSIGGEEYGSGSVPIEGKYIGDKTEYPVLEPCFYQAIENNPNIIQAVSKYEQSEDISSVINKYCHDVLCNDMGIDFLYASTGRAGGCYVVLKDNCMKLSKFGW